MFSGKTQRLLDTLTRYADMIGIVLGLANSRLFKVLLIVPQKAGDREEGKDLDSNASRKGVSSHASGFYKVSEHITVVYADKLSDVDSLEAVHADGSKAICVSGFDVVGIDEGGFFPDLYETVKKWKLEKEKIIYVAGLDGSAKRTPLGQMLDLIPISNDYTKCKAMCLECVSENKQAAKPGFVFPAAFTKISVAMTDDIMVGGRNMYTAVCDKHFKEPPG